MKTPSTHPAETDTTAGVVEHQASIGEALVVHESMFGNTAEIAKAVSCGLAHEGLLVTTVAVATAPDLATVNTDLLVLGGPTHAFSMSRPGTRQDAVRQGAAPDRATVGLREWLTAGASPGDAPTRLAAVFDTRASKVRYLPKSASAGSGHLLRRLGFTLLGRPTGFLVAEVKGPLLPGETERAIAWGRELGRSYKQLRETSLVGTS